MGFDEYNQSYLTVLIENLDRADGILINDYMHPVNFYNGLALGFDYPGPNIITNVSNGSGILAPGSSATVEVNMNTASLSEGVVNRYINIISNDPLNKQKIALVQLNIDHGGTAQPVLSTNVISFGNVFKGATRSQIVAIKNEGTAAAKINSVTLTKGSFTVSGNKTATISPGLFENFTVTIPTTKIATLSDVIHVTYADGSSQTINVTGKVVAPPAISVNLTTINKIVDYGEKASVPFTVSNTGTADLEFATTGKQWLYFESSQTPATVTYEVQKENTGGVYQWLDIRKTGEQLPFAIDLNDETQYWKNITLPFSFEYFGKSYTALKVGENGIVSFEDAPPVMEFSDSIPSAIYPGAYIMPYWTFGGFNTYTYKKEDVGIFYQFFPDKAVITWSYLVNSFSGMGDPVSVQLILYNNGSMRFQYRVEETGSDLTSRLTIIGLQESTDSGVVVSDRLALDHGKGLAFNLFPVKKYNIKPATSLSGNIVLDATNTYSGNYTSTLRMFTNVPNKENLEKPVTLTINGFVELAVPAATDFGQKIIATEDGSPVVYPVDIDITNTGNRPIDITWIENASGGTQPLGLQLYALVDGWFGATWEWVDVSYLFSPWNASTPVFQIMPGDKLKARATFYPSEVGDFADEIVLSTTAGEKRIALNGTGIEPPSIEIAADPIKVSLNSLDETATHNIAFNNLNGKSRLTVNVSIAYDRGVATQLNESVAATAHNILKQTDASAPSGIGTSEAYNRTLKYSERTTPDNHVGTGGTEPFTVATKFNAGNKGFNLSHVETWFRAELMAAGDIELEIRAGSSIEEAATLAQTKINFNRSGEDQQGNWMQLALEQPVFIYPNEDFFVLITYPFEIPYPQGIIRNEPRTPGRYLYAQSGVWSDIQNDDGFTTAAWLMYAAEQVAQTSSWITSSADDSLDVGEESAIEIMFNGALASRGDQFATVVVSTNDPTKKTINIPVTLHVNQAAQFGEVPDPVVIAENDTVVVEIPVVDIEGNAVTISPDATFESVASNFENGILKITLTPKFGSAGNHTYQFNALDEFGAASSVLLNVQVDHTNQPPRYIGNDQSLSLYPTNNLEQFSIVDYFSDPDGDVFTFSVVSSDTSILEVYSSPGKFLMNAKKTGNTTLQFTVRDIYGATAIKGVPIVINMVLGIEENFFPNGVKVFPNPAQQFITAEFGNEWQGQKVIEIIDVNGRKHTVATGNRATITIDVSDYSSGLYILRTSTANKSTSNKILIK
jgi:hypothetical protein